MRRPFKTTDIWLAAGFVLIFVGLWKLFERLLTQWWPSLSFIMSGVIGVIWPIAIIVAGALVIYAARNGSVHSTGRYLLRSICNRKVAGVCGGVAEYFGVDPALIRTLCIILTVLTLGMLGIVYLICWMVIPEQVA